MPVPLAICSQCSATMRPLSVEAAVKSFVVTYECPSCANLETRVIMQETLVASKMKKTISK